MEERAFWVALGHIEGLGGRRLSRLVRHFGSARGAWEASAAELERVEGLPARERLALLGFRQRTDPASLAASLERRGIAGLTRLDPGYPPDLLRVPELAPVLFVRGRSEALSGPAVAVVGTRRPTPYGREITATLCGDLALAGVVVVSGLAVGIDTTAHRSALRAGGLTVAVLGSGLDHLYPRGNADLAADILATGGAVISQFQPDTLPSKPRFVMRNRVLAGLGRGTVVTEAPLGSGALRTAGFSLQMGRATMAVPGPVSSPTYEGCLDLLRRGARPVGTVHHILTDSGLGAAEGDGGATRFVADPVSVGSRPRLPAGAATVLDALSPGEVAPFALLLTRTGLSAGRLGSLLGLLEVKGLVLRQPGPSYARRKLGGGEP